MKNFPHQANDAETIRNVLAIAVRLVEAGRDFDDDTVFGYTLVDQGVYRFRKSDPPIPPEDRIRLEQQKPSGKQGPRTAAREYRRTLALLGFIVEHAGGWQATREGSALIESEPGSEAERVIWQQALYDLELVDENGPSSHPIRILLRLIDEARDQLGPNRQGLELALVAHDDSDREFQRIVQLLEYDLEERMTMLGVSMTRARNAVKILPSLAEQFGLITAGDEHTPYYVSDVGMQALDEHADTVSGQQPSGGERAFFPSPRDTARTVTPETVASFSASSTDYRGSRTLTSEEQRLATRLRFERTFRHQQLVRNLASHLADGMELSEDPRGYDLFAVPANRSHPALLFEAKTISDSDELSQTIRGLGQLTLYHYRLHNAHENISEVLVFDASLRPEHASLLDWRGVAAYRCDAQSLTPLNERGRELLQIVTGS